MLSKSPSKEMKRRSEAVAHPFPVSSSKHRLTLSVSTAGMGGQEEEEDGEEG